MSYARQMLARWPADGPCLSLGEDRRSYAEQRVRVHQARTWLRQQGLSRGDVLALQLPRSLVFLDLHLAALLEGIATLPINPRYTKREVAFLLEDARPALFLSGEEGLRSAEGLAASPPAADTPTDGLDREVALLCYTSGTTGRPKGALIEHRNLEAGVRALHEAWAWSPEDHLLHTLPLFHIHGLIVAQHVALWAGASTLLLPRFEPRAVLEELSTGRHTIFMGVPTFYHRLLSEDDAPSPRGMRLFTSGSAPLPSRDFDTFRDRFGHEILERYGMTEVGIVLSNPLHGPRKAGSVGRPLPGVRCRIVDPAGDELAAGQIGEVQIAGPSVFRGYLHRPEATASALADGWMHTGDLGLRDEDHYVHLQGRRNDLILSGGFNVYPVEVESLLREHPAVAAAAVVGVPDPDMGEHVVALVVVRGDVDPEDLRDFARQHLTAYKVPSTIRLVEALPRNSMGKVLKSEIRDQWSDSGGLPPGESPMTAPFADEIRLLRPGAACARGAAIDLARLGGLSPEFTRHEPDRLHRELATEILDRWLPAAPDARLADAHAIVAPLAKRSMQLSSELEALLHKQHESLHDPRYQHIVEEVRGLSTQQQGLEGQRGKLRHRVVHLAATATAVERALSAFEAAAPSNRPALAKALVDGLRAVFDASGLEDPNALEIDPQTWLEGIGAWLSEQHAMSEPQADALDERHDKLASRLSELLG